MGKQHTHTFHPVSQRSARDSEKKRATQPSTLLQPRSFQSAIAQHHPGENIAQRTAVSKNSETSQSQTNSSSTPTPFLWGENTSTHIPTQPIQAKLTIGEPNDRYEQEADQVAAQVVQHINNPQISSPQAFQRKKEVQRKPDITPIGRQGTRSPFIHRSPIPVGPASDTFENRLSQARGGGIGLEPQTRAKMESAIGADFSNVRIHTDHRSDQLNQSIQAKAFTTGQDIFFKRGEYSPTSREGQELLAHELTHVVQQNGPGVSRKASSSAPEHLQYDVLHHQKNHALQTQPENNAFISPKSKGEAPQNVIQRGIGSSIKSGVKKVGSAIGKGVKGILGFVVNIGAWVAKALIKGVTGGLTSLVRLFNLPRVLRGAKLESLKDITENLERAGNDSKGKGVKFASGLNILSIVVGDIANIAGAVALLSGLIGLIPGAQPALAVSGMAGLIGMIATGVKTAIDLASVAILKFSQLDSDDQKFYADKKKDLAADAIGLAAGGIAGGLASMAGGSSAGEAFKGAFLPNGGAATGGIAGIVENSVGSMTNASAGGLTETITGTEADENAVGGVGEYEGKDFKARLAQDAYDKLEMITDPLKRLQKTWNQIKNIFSSVAQAFKDFWTNVSSLFSKGKAEKENDPNKGGQTDPKDKKIEKDINQANGQQSQKEGNKAIDTVTQGAGGMAQGLAKIITAIDAKKALLKRSATT